MLALDDLAASIELEDVGEVGWAPGRGPSGGLHLDRDNPAVWGSPQLVRPTHEAMNPARYGGHPAHGGRSHVTVHRYHRSRESLRVQGSVEGPGDDEDYQGNKWFHHSTPSGDMFLSS